MSGKKAKSNSIRVSSETLDRLTKLKAPKQVYDGFISQLLDLWEEKLGEKLKEEKPGSAGGNQGAVVSHRTA